MTTRVFKPKKSPPSLATAGFYRARKTLAAVTPRNAYRT
jgi:hypothetical protein